MRSATSRGRAVVNMNPAFGPRWEWLPNRPGKTGRLASTVVRFEAAAGLFE
jgi:hypothetical protein